MSEQSSHEVDMVTPFDLIAMGRIGVDLYPLQDAVALEDVTSFGKYLGGSPANVTVAAARHGHRAALISRTGDDAFGRFLRTELARLGVDSHAVLPLPGAHTTLAFCELFPPDNFPLTFYRDTVAPELQISPDSINHAAIAAARILWITATAFSADPSRAAHHSALTAREGRTTVLDLDHRAGFWRSDEEARAALSKVWQSVTVAVGNLEECRVAVGESDPDRAADALLDRGVELAIVKLGGDGVMGATRNERLRIPPTPVDVVNGLGAGDAFGGALVHAVLEGWNLDQLLRFASAAGAIVAGRRECALAMPTTSEVADMLARPLG